MANQVLDHTGAEMEIEAFHPGEFLLEEIELRQLVKKDVAVALCIKPRHLSELFVGKRNISAKLAIKIEHLLDINSNYWLGMQSEYDLFVARQNLPCNS